MAAPPRHPVTPAVIHLAYSGATVAGAALPLPPAPEPLVVARTTAADRPRNRVPAAPRKGLVAAIADWIRSVRRLTLVGLLPRKRRAPLPKPPTHLTAVSRPRSPAEAERLRHENEALRKRLATLEAIEALRSARGKAGA
ncbi:MAG: hypothetical protein KGN34_16810 [Sphingomonadales bacterium]|nr:hypothetical protein [Sphingomonadales bacterium]